MSQTGSYIKVKDILFNAAGFAGDTDYRAIPKGFYIQQIEDAFKELNMETKMLDGHANFDTPIEHLSIPLPADCFNVQNVWMYSGTECDFHASRKVWPKDNYYTEGDGYLANRTGNNTNDPYYLNDSLTSRLRPDRDLSLIRYDNNISINQILFYNIQNGVLMLSASCRAAGNKVHIHYNSTGCEVGEAPIIPLFYKKAIEDYTTEAALRFRMANDIVNARAWQPLWQIADRNLDKNGYNGSWQTALVMARSMSSDQKKAIGIYMGKAAWATGK